MQTGYCPAKDVKTIGPESGQQAYFTGVVYIGEGGFVETEILLSQVKMWTLSKRQGCPGRTSVILGTKQRV